MMLPCGIILAVGMLVIMIRTIRAMNRIMEGMYKVYLAECTSTDYDYDPEPTRTPVYDLFDDIGH